MTLLTNTNNMHNIEFKAPDGGWGWVIAISSLFIHFLMDGVTYSLGTFLTYFTEEYHVSYAEASFVHSLLPAITYMSGPIASIFTNKYGCRITTIIGTVVAAFGFFLSFFVKSFYLLYITIGVIAGIGFGLIYVPAIVSVGFYFEKKRSLAMGIAVCGSGLGTFVFSPINRILINNFGLSGSFLIISGILLNLIACGLVIRPVPIEPSEIEKLKKKQRKMEIDQTYSNNLKKPFLNNPNNKNKNVNGSLNVDNEVASLPSISINIEESKDQDIEYKFVKSAPSLNNQQLTIKSHTSSNENVCKYLNTTKNSALNIFALARSSENIPINYIENDDTADNGKTKNSIKETLKTMIDVSLFVDPVFMYFTASNFLTSLGFNAPYIYIVDQATHSFNVEPESADMLLSSIGISNTIGRIVIGYLGGLKKVNRIHLYSTVLTICGVATMAEPLATYLPGKNFQFIGLLFYSLTFGFFSGGYVSITSLLLVDLLGLERMTNSFGILIMFQGIATMIGPPLAGLLYDSSKSYVLPFVFTGLTIAVSGAMCFLIPCFNLKSKIEK